MRNNTQKARPIAWSEPYNELAGEVGIEPTTDGVGSRHSTTELHPQ